MRSGHLTIVMYHGIVRFPLAVDDWCFLGEREFRRQMRLLKAHFEVVSLSAGVERLRARDLARPAAAITFDDGFLNNFTVAFPILRSEGLPATIFPATKFTGTSDTVWFCTLQRALSSPSASVLSWGGTRFDLTTAEAAAKASHVLQENLKRLPQPELLFELRQILNQLGASMDTAAEADSPFRMLAPREISEMSRSGLIDFGAHGHSHMILRLLPPAQREHEISRSLAVIRNVTGRPCSMFAYPNGTPRDYDLSTIRTLQRHGVEIAVTTVEGRNTAATSPMLLRRYGIGSATAPEDFRRILRDSGVMRDVMPRKRGSSSTAREQEVERLFRDWITVSPEDVLPTVKKWRFHLETLRQFDETPDIAPRDTAYFAGVKEYRAAGGEFWADCTTDDALVAQIEHFRRLFLRIRTRGFSRSKPIIVCIDHDGSITVFDGHHRAAIAVFLDLSIPAKVRWRHPDWTARVSPSGGAATGSTP